MRNLRHILVLLLAVATAIFAVATSAGGSPTRRLAVHRSQPSVVPGPNAVTGGLIVGLANGAAGFGGQSTAPEMTQMMDGTGAKWFRDSFQWSKIEPRRGKFNFSYYDHYMLVAGQHGLHIVAQLLNAPRWAGRTSSSIPANPQLFAEFVAAVVGRYGVGGSFWKAHPNLAGSAITAFELWNEPYYDTGNAGHYNPGLYARMFKAAAIAGHAVSPSTSFLLEAQMQPHLNGVWTWWVDALYKALPDLNKYFQGVAAHDFGKDVKNLAPIVFGQPYANFGRLRRIEDLRRQFLRHGAGDKPFWILETGWPTCTLPDSDCVTAAQQRANLGTLIEYVRGPWKGWVQSVFVYRYKDGPDPNTVQGGYGLIYKTGKPKLALPVFERFAATSVN
jgi:Beta-galactosidase